MYDYMFIQFWQRYFFAFSEIQYNLANTGRPRNHLQNATMLWLKLDTFHTRIVLMQEKYLVSRTCHCHVNSQTEHKSVSHKKDRDQIQSWFCLVDGGKFREFWTLACLCKSMQSGWKRAENFNFQTLKIQVQAIHLVLFVKLQFQELHFWEELSLNNLLWSFFWHQTDRRNTSETLAVLNKGYFSSGLGIHCIFFPRSSKQTTVNLCAIIRHYAFCSVPSESNNESNWI